MKTSTALERYNRLFDNVHYQALAERIAADLNTTRDDVAVSDVCNMITDTALGLCEHPSYADAWLTLATFCGQNAMRLSNIDAIHRYLTIYQQTGDTRVDDFALTAKALMKVYDVNILLKEAVSNANGVHGWRGRIAYDLLAASDTLTQAAVQLLIHGDASYIREKLGHALRRIRGALREGKRQDEKLCPSDELSPTVTDSD